MATETPFDFIIIGSGLVGGSLALTLAHAGLRIALVDRATFQPTDARLFALNFHSITRLKMLGLWDALADHASAIHQVHVSHQGHFGAVTLSREDSGLSSLGHVVPALFIEKALHHAISQHPHIVLFCPYTLKNAEQTADAVTVILSDENNHATHLTAQFLMGADGSHSRVRDLFHFQVETIDHQQSALVTQTILQRSHQHIAYERFLNKNDGQGTIAMLPLAPRAAATIWTGDTAWIHALLAMPDALFLSTLQKQFGYRLGRFLANQTKCTYPLKTILTEKIAHHRIGLIGNAAHTLHPIAAQGFNLALYEITILAQLINHMQKNSALLSASLLNNYDEATAVKRKDIAKTSCDIVSLFRRQIPGMTLALTLGFLGLDHFSFAKEKFIRQMTYQDTYQFA